MPKSVKSTWLPIASFGLAILLSLLGSPAGISFARRAPMQATPCSHVFTQTVQDPECTSEENGVAGNNCEKVVPDDVAGMEGEKLWFLDKGAEGNLIVNSGARDGAFVVGDPLGKNSFAKVLTRTTTAKCDPCHDIISGLLIFARVEVRLDAPAPLAFGAQALGRGFTSVQGKRFADCVNLNESKAVEISASFRRFLTPAGRLEDTCKTVVLEVGKPPVVERRPGGNLGPNICFEFRNLSLDQQANPAALDARAFVLYHAEAQVQILRAAPGADRTASVTCKSEVESQVLVDTTEGIGN